MMTQQQKERQKKRLNAVKWPEWRKAIDELTLKISCLLHGHIEEDELGVKHVVGGYTQYGAHSAYERGGEALYDYESTIVSKLFNCECEWKEGLSLSDQLKEIAILRLENPDSSLKDLGTLLDPPVGKSGVNHRLRKISLIAEELRNKNAG